MSKSANSGELRTPVVIEQFIKTGVNRNGYEDGYYKNIFGDSVAIKVKWVNAHGTDIYHAMSLDLREPVTITMRYSPLLTPQCRLIRAEDNHKENKETLYYEIISIDDVDNRHQWLEIKAQRMVSAK